MRKTLLACLFAIAMAISTIPMSHAAIYKVELDLSGQAPATGTLVGSFLYDDVQQLVTSIDLDFSGGQSDSNTAYAPATFVVPRTSASFPTEQVEAFPAGVDPDNIVGSTPFFLISTRTTGTTWTDPNPSINSAYVATATSGDVNNFLSLDGTVTSTVVPVPPAFALFLSAVGVLGLLRRRSAS